jgi:hypothetical protein
MKKNLMILSVLVMFGLATVLAADEPVTTPARTGAAVKTQSQVQTQTGGQTTNQAQIQNQRQSSRGVHYVDANGNGVCDHFENGTPQGRMNRGGRGGAGKGAGQGVMARDGSGGGQRHGRGRSGGAGRGYGQRLRDGSCRNR